MEDLNFIKDDYIKQGGKGVIFIHTTFDVIVLCSHEEKKIRESLVQQEQTTLDADNRCSTYVVRIF